MVRAFYLESLTTPGYATDSMIHSDYLGQDGRQKGMLKLMVIDTSLRNCYESSRFIGQLDDPETAILGNYVKVRMLTTFLIGPTSRLTAQKIMSHE